MKEYPVILVDADLRRAADLRPADLFEVSPTRPGLLQALSDETPIASLLCPTENPGLRLMTAGCCPPDETVTPESPEELASKPPTPVSARRSRAYSGLPPAGRRQEHDLSRLGSRQFRSVLNTLRQSGRHLVYDLPPVGTHETVLEAAASLGNVILVARSGHTGRVQLREAVRLLEDRGAQVRGILVTDIPADLLEGAPQFPVHRRHPKWSRWLHRFPPAAARDASAIT
jgi:Mrp family chromosome partitioning ATPase